MVAFAGEHLNDPNYIEATDLSRLAIKYRYSNNEREKYNLLMEIAEQSYLPKINSLIKNYNGKYREDILQMYYLAIAESLNSWSLKANYATYLWPFVRGVIREFHEKILAEPKHYVLKSRPNIPNVKFISDSAIPYHKRVDITDEHDAYDEFENYIESHERTAQHDLETEAYIKEMRKELELD